MAENIQRRMEAMEVEFEEMAKIFSDDVCRTIKKRRKDFEYKVNSFSKQLLHYKEYINYESCLYKVIKSTKGKLPNSEKKGSLEFKVLRRIKTLYLRCIQIFPKDIDIYSNFFKFCEEINYRNAASEVCTNMLKSHQKNENIWLLAARWYLHDGKDLSIAISCLQKGIAANKTSKKLYIECMKYEMNRFLIKNKKMKNDKHHQEQDDPGDVYHVINGRLEKYIEEMISLISDPQHYIDVIEWLEKYDFTMPVQNIIVEYLLNTHCDKAIVWDFVAKREKRGYHRGSTEDCKHLTNKAKIMFCIEKYEEGLKIVSNEDKSTLWNCYLECLVDMKNEEFSVATKKILKHAFERASASGYLPDKYYINWLDFVDNDEAQNILKLGTEKLPHSVDLWNLRLKFEILKDHRPDILHVFKLGSEALKENGCSFWLLMLKYHTINSKEDEVEEFYKTAIKQHTNIAQSFKAKYIEWISLNKGIAQCRKVYSMLWKEKPYCQELYKTICQLESAQINNDFQMWEQVHISSCDQIGSENVEVWLNYIKFFMFYNKVHNAKEHIAAIMEKAKSRLADYLHIDFDEKYNDISQQFNLTEDEM